MERHVERSARFGILLAGSAGRSAVDDRRVVDGVNVQVQIIPACFTSAVLRYRILQRNRTVGVRRGSKVNGVVIHNRQRTKRGVGFAERQGVFDVVGIIDR
ncbi:hypothetical protein SDC9_62727 [bioreactor metagenome]|uniref:Uncharacterized protein n=1 Tax=bioreactor metagenome TaxID=1076179 RepID=A0A644XJS5_9ZZZZ